MKSHRLIILGCLAGTLAAQVSFDRILNSDKEPQNWLTYGGGYRSLRYSELRQITPANAADLDLKWVFQAKSLDAYQTTPLVVDGVLYTMQADDVIALDATTGRTFWAYRYMNAPDMRPCCGKTSRGLAILGDKIFLATLDSHLVALDAKTGRPLWDTVVAKGSAGYSMTMAPLAVKDKVIVGVAGGDLGIRGFLAAYNAETGRQVWRFDTVPGPGEVGFDTWAGDSWKKGGGSVWNTGSYDAETNLTIWGIGNAGPDYNGDVRAGDNLYTSSLIALDVDTGQLKWHYQYNPHNEFDWDGVQVPVLADIEWQGKPRKVVLTAQRNGFFYVLDRVTGKFLLGRPFVKQNWNLGFDEIGRPIMAPEAKSSKEGTLIFPDNQGGTNWFNPSFSPRTGLFYVAARENFSSNFGKSDVTTLPPDGASYTGGTPNAGRGRGGAGGRFQRPEVGGDEDKYTAVRALDPLTGEKKWQFILNEGNGVSPCSSLACAGASGILTTASDVLFAGGREGNFQALDARTGALLWKTLLGGQIIMGPITYSVEGKQYVAVNAGNSLFVFALR